VEHKEKFEASQSHDGRYRMLVDAVTDYAIYMLDPNGSSQKGVGEWSVTVAMPR
jgi:hypothetical protein